MAKRTNQNSNKKKSDPSENRTVIKLTSQKKERKPASSRRSTSSKKDSRTETENQNKSRSKTRPPHKVTVKNKPQPEPEKKVSTQTSEQPPSTPAPSSNKPAANPPAQKSTTPFIPPTVEGVKISQSVAILIDGNNIEMSLTKLTNNKSAVLNFDKVIPKLLNGRGLNRLIYFREGRSISQKLADRLHTHYFGSVVPCHKSADIPLSIQATQLAEKVDTIIILSGDSDYVELVRHVKSKGVRVEIAAIEITTAAILKEEADYYIPITEEDAFIVK
jgi:NYN domain-containing protein